MSLSLEVKKFVNSENIGDFVTIVLPGELPAGNAEIRAMNRERAAAEKAARAALALEEDEKLRKSDADEAARAFEEAKKALSEQDKAFSEQKKEHERLKSEHGKKKDALDKARKALDEGTAEEAKLSAALNTLNEAFSAAEKAKNEAEETLSELKKAQSDKEKAEAKAKQTGADKKNKKGAKPSDKAAETKTEAKIEDAPAANEQPKEGAEKAEKSADKPAEAAQSVKDSEKPEEKSENKAEDKSKAEEKIGETPDSKTETKPDDKAGNAAAAENGAAAGNSEGSDSITADGANDPEAEKNAEAKEAAEPEAKPQLTLEEAEKAVESAKAAFDKAKAERDSAQKAHKSAAEAESKKKKEHDKLAAEFAQLNALFESESAEFERAGEEHAAEAEHTRALEKANNEAKTRLSEAQKAHESGVKEASRLKAAVRTIKTEHETASMHYLESGKGETLILIHTAGQSLFTFRNVFYKLAMNYRVIAIDLMGHGCSDRPDYFDYSIESHAESILSFMDAMGIERAHLLGFSMGAGYALELARRYPDRVMSVVALSPGGVTNTMPLPIRMMESALFGGIASRLFRVKTVEKLLDDCLFDHTVIGPHEVAEYFKSSSDGEGRRAIRLSVSSFGEKELLGSLSEVRPNVLVVSSDKDRWHSPEHGEAYANALKEGTFVTVRNAGHLFHEEKPDRIVDIIRSFIPAGYGDYDGREF